MGTVSGYKAVSDTYESFEGPPELAALRQTYTVGATITPDPATESAAKAAAGGQIATNAAGVPNCPNGTNGVYVYVNEPGLGDNRALGWARRMAQGARVVRLTFDDANVISIYGDGPTGLSGAPVNVRTYQVSSVHVEEEIGG